MENKRTLEGMCESCMMPFKKDPLGEKREHDKYCSYCYANSGLTYPGNDVKEFKKGMVEVMVAGGSSRIMANIYAFMAGFAPRWKGTNSTVGKAFGSYGEKCAEDEVKKSDI